MKYSAQRDVIHNIVKNSFDHPNAEMVLARAKEVMPSINLATVYRNLTALSAVGKVNRISISSGDRFDGTLKPHAHCHCTKCNKVFDIDIAEFERFISVKEKDFSIEKIDVVLSGVCSECSKI